MIINNKTNRCFVGAFLIDGDLEGTKLTVTKKPNVFRIFFTWLFLGWKWISIEEMKRKSKEDKE